MLCAVVKLLKGCLISNSPHYSEELGILAEFERNGESLPGVYFTCIMIKELSLDCCLAGYQAREPAAGETQEDLNAWLMQALSYCWIILMKVGRLRQTEKEISSCVSKTLYLETAAALP